MTSLRRWAAVFVPSPGEDDGGLPLSARGWRTTIVGLHVIAAIVWALAVVGAFVTDDGEQRAIALSALGVLGVAYVLAGAPAIEHGYRVRGVVYLAVLVLVFAVLGFVDPSLFFLLFLAYPQLWFVVQGTAAGVGWTVLLALGTAAGPIASAGSGASTREILLSTGIGMLFSLALGLWISRVVVQSSQRASLIEQLERTRAELAVAHHEAGVLAERERLAREVHDTLAQGYTSIVVLAQTAAGQVATDPDAARERLRLIEEVARDNLQEARALVAAYRPVGLEESTLAEALPRLADRFARETGIPVRVDTGGLSEGLALRRDEEVVLLRGAQEALTNVRRHAAARAVVVRLTQVGEGGARQVSVHVEDDGVGFDPAIAAGAGLEGLRSRVAQVGGEVDVVSAPGEGTRVTVRVPGA